MGDEPIPVSMTAPLLEGVTPAAYLITVALIYDPWDMRPLLFMTLEFFNSFSLEFLEIISSMLFSDGLTGLGPSESLALIYLATLELGKHLLMLGAEVFLMIWRLLGRLFASFGERLATLKRRRDVYSATYQLVPGSYQYDQLVGRECMRLLELWPPGASEGVFCGLFQILLAREPSYHYEAISYKWTDPTEGIIQFKSITVNGRDFQAPKNVYHILCDRSSSWAYRYLWIDSICIDQKNKGEMADQVKLMRQIYEMASRVIVCLGNAPDASLAVEVLKELSLLKEYYASSAEVNAKFRSEVKSSRWCAMDDLFDNPWFQRVWVIQEVTVTRKIVVRYGGFSIHWQTISSVAEVLTSSNEVVMFNASVQKNDRIREDSLDGMGRLLLICESRDDFQNRIPISMQQMLVRYATFQAKDPRDKIFALLGCVSSVTELPHEFLANYLETNTAETLYTNVAHYILPSRSNYIFPHAGIGWSRNCNDLPSWVPDWTSHTTGPSILSGEDSKYHSGGSSKFRMTSSPDSIQIAIEGILVDTIKAVGSTDWFGSGP